MSAPTIEPDMAMWNLRTHLEDEWDGKFQALCPHGTWATWSAFNGPFCRCEQ